MMEKISRNIIEINFFSTFSLTNRKHKYAVDNYKRTVVFLERFREIRTFHFFRAFLQFTRLLAFSSYYCYCSCLHIMDISAKVIYFSLTADKSM